MNIWRGDSVSSMVPDEGVKQPRGWHGLTMDRARDCRYADAPSAELLSILPRCDTRCVCNGCARPTRAPRSSCISCSAIASLQPWNLSCRAVTWGGETRVDFSTDENLLWHHLKCMVFIFNPWPLEEIRLRTCLSLDIYLNREGWLSVKWSEISSILSSPRIDQYGAVVRI